MRKFRLRGVRVSPSLVIASIALFVALSSTGIAATIVPLAKRALTADTAKVANRAKVADKAKVATMAKSADSAQTAATAATANTATTAGDAATLNGLTAQQIAVLPGPGGLIPAGSLTVRSTSWSTGVKGTRVDARALCNSGEKAIAGGYDVASGIPFITNNRPLSDLSGWWVQAYQAEEDTSPSNGSAWVVCAKVS